MWNKEAAINFVRHNAHPHATGYCARAVTAAIEHGGVSLHHDNAKNMGKYLVLAGFREVYGNPIKGDVAIIQPYTGGNTAGHMAIFDGITGGQISSRNMACTPGLVIVKVSLRINYIGTTDEAINIIYFSILIICYGRNSSC